MGPRDRCRASAQRAHRGHRPAPWGVHVQRQRREGRGAQQPPRGARPEEQHAQGRRGERDGQSPGLEQVQVKERLRGRMQEPPQHAGDRHDSAASLQQVHWAPGQQRRQQPRLHSVLYVLAAFSVHLLGLQGVAEELQQP